MRVEDRIAERAKEISKLCNKYFHYSGWDVYGWNHDLELQELICAQEIDIEELKENGRTHDQ